MRVDIVTLVAQLVNFGLLVVVLWRVLFRPLADTLQHREERMRAELASAERARSEAEHEAATLQAERERLEQARARGLQDLDAEIEAHRGHLLDEIHGVAEEERAKQRRRLYAEREEVLAHLRRAGGRLLGEVVDRGLRDLTGRSLHEAALARFEERLGSLPEDQRELLRTGATAGSGLTLASAEALDGATRERLAQLLRRELGVAGALRFVRDPTLLAGLELRSGDYGLGWSVRHLAADLCDAFGAGIDAELGVDAGPDDTGRSDGRTAT